MYDKQIWKDEIPDLTKPILDANGKQKTDPQTGRPLFELVQEGTRITSTRLNKMEIGIGGAHDLVEMLAKELGGNFVASSNGAIGFQFSTKDLTVSWTTGIAYVGGRRFEVLAGSLPLNPTQGQYLYLDLDGKIKKTTSEATAVTALLLWYMATDASGVITSTDKRSAVNMAEILKRIENIDVDIPNASLTQKGISQLNSAIDSTSETQAATPKAVKTVNDSLVSHKADNTKHVPHLGTTVNLNNYYSITTTEVIDVNQKFTIAFNSASISTGAPTLNVSSIGIEKPIRKPGGSYANIKVGVYTVFWDGTSFQLLGEGGEILTGDAIAANVLATKTFYKDNPTTKLTGAMPDLAATNIQSSFTEDVTIPDGYRNGSGKVLQPLVRAGDFPCYTDDRGSVSPYESYAKYRDVIVSKTGTYRVSFKLQVGNTMYTVYGRIYKNGVAVGTERICSVTSTITFTEDLYLIAGDHVQLYARMLSGANGGTVYGFNITIANSNPTAIYSS